MRNLEIENHHLRRQLKEAQENHVQYAKCCASFLVAHKDDPEKLAFIVEHGLGARDLYEPDPGSYHPDNPPPPWQGCEICGGDHKTPTLPGSYELGKEDPDASAVPAHEGGRRPPRS